VVSNIFPKAQSSQLIRWNHVASVLSETLGIWASLRESFALREVLPNLFKQDVLTSRRSSLVAPRENVTR